MPGGLETWKLSCQGPRVRRLAWEAKRSEAKRRRALEAKKCQNRWSGDPEIAPLIHHHHYPYHHVHDQCRFSLLSDHISWYDLTTMEIEVILYICFMHHHFGFSFIDTETCPYLSSIISNMIDVEIIEHVNEPVISWEYFKHLINKNHTKSQTDINHIKHICLIILHQYIKAGSPHVITLNNIFKHDWKMRHEHFKHISNQATITI